MQVDRCTSGNNCIVIVQVLSFFTLIPLLNSYRKHGKLRVLYVTSNVLGIRVSNLLYRTSVLSCKACQIPREEIYPIDSSDNKAHINKTETYNELSELQQTIFNLINKTIKNVDTYYRKLLVANIIKRCNDDFRNHEQQRLMNYAYKILEKNKNNVVVILRHLLVRGYKRMAEREQDWLDDGVVYQFTFSKNILVALARALYRVIVSMTVSYTHLRAHET